MADTIQARVAATLRGTRKEKGYTQETLADAAEVSAKTVKRAEAGERVSAESLRALCAVLGLDIAALLSDAMAAPEGVRRRYLRVYPFSPRPFHAMPGSAATMATAAMGAAMALQVAFDAAMASMGGGGILRGVFTADRMATAAPEEVAAIVGAVFPLSWALAMPLVGSFLFPLLHGASVRSRHRHPGMGLFEAWPRVADSFLVGFLGVLGAAATYEAGAIGPAAAAKALNAVAVAQLAAVGWYWHVARRAAEKVHRRRAEVRWFLVNLGGAYLEELARIAADRLSGDAVARAERILDDYRAMAEHADWYEGLRMVERFVEDLANGVSGTAGLLEHLDRARLLDGGLDGAPPEYAPRGVRPAASAPRRPGERADGALARRGERP